MHMRTFILFWTSSIWSAVVGMPRSARLDKPVEVTSAKVQKRYAGHKSEPELFRCANDNLPSEVIQIGYYTDKNCQDRFNLRSYFGCPEYQPGTASCGRMNVWKEGPIYAKVIHAQNPQVMLALIRDEASCPEGAAGVIATLWAESDICVELLGLTGDEGALLYSQGKGEAFAKRNNGFISLLPRVYNVEEVNKIHKRDDDPFPQLPQTFDVRKLNKKHNKCKQFVSEKQVSTYSPSVRLSDTINCQNSASPCVITNSVQHTTTISTTVQLSTGFTFLGFHIGPTISEKFTDTVVTTNQSSFTVQPDQEGFLTAYSQATRFEGYFTQCKNGKDIPAKIVALKTDGLIYAMVATNQ